MNPQNASPIFRDEKAKPPAEEKKNTLTDMGGLRAIKILIALFVSFLFVTSEGFNDHVLGFASGTSRGGVPTVKGSCIQGIFLVLFYVLFVYLLEKEVV